MAKKIGPFRFEILVDADGNLTVGNTGFCVCDDTTPGLNYDFVGPVPAQTARELEPGEISDTVQALVNAIRQALETQEGIGA